MALPAQIRKQSEDVQELYKQLNAGTSASTTKVETPAAAAEPAAVEDNAPDSVDEPVSKTPAVEPAVVTTEDYVQKYRTLQGMYNKEVPRLTAENQALSARLSSMEELLASMQAAPAPEKPAETPKSLLTEDEIGEYGESIDIMRKVSQETTAPFKAEIDRLNGVISELQGSVVPQVQQIGAHQARSDDQRFWAGLDAQVSGWRETNDDPDFQSWLLEVDPLSGYTRQSFLEDAQRKLDVNRVAGFFTSWRKLAGHSDAQTNRSAASTELEKQVAPGRGRSTSTPTSGEKRTYSSKDISNFFNDVRMGKYKGKEDERGKLERDIFLAQREGRIV